MVVPNSRSQHEKHGMHISPIVYLRMSPEMHWYHRTFVKGNCTKILYCNGAEPLIFFKRLHKQHKLREYLYN